MGTEPRKDEGQRRRRCASGPADSAIQDEVCAERSHLRRQFSRDGALVCRVTTRPSDACRYANECRARVSRELYRLPPEGVNLPARYKKTINSRRLFIEGAEAGLAGLPINADF